MAKCNNVEGCVNVINAKNELRFEGLNLKTSTDIYIDEKDWILKTVDKDGVTCNTINSGSYPSAAFIGQRGKGEDSNCSDGTTSLGNEWELILGPKDGLAILKSKEQKNINPPSYTYFLIDRTGNIIGAAVKGKMKFSGQDIIFSGGNCCDLNDK
jgi:hypothetical protein